MDRSAAGWHGALPDLPAADDQSRSEELVARFDRLFAAPAAPPSAADLDDACGADTTVLYRWCAATFRFLLVTADLVQALADELRASGSKRCLEVGAGRGELTLALQAHGIDCVATDDRSWQVRPRATGGIYGAHVLNLAHGNAIKRLQPDTVLSAWMPNGEDWTPAFRAAQGLQRYLLFGTGTGGHVGAEATWAEHNGWRRRALPVVAAGARCRIDSLLGTPYARRNTVAVVYERSGQGGE